MKKISIGVPCYNEEDNIELMYKAISSQMEKLKTYDYEIIFADNCSKDNSQEILRKISKKDKKVKIIFNQNNFGPERSGINCYKNASGDAYIGIPCDFQEPPELIPFFVSEWEKGYDIVWGQKTESKESKIKFLCRKIFYGIINFLSDKPQLSQTTGFGLMDKKVIDILLVTQEQDPEYNARYLVCDYGFSIKLIPYEQKLRERGESSYSIYSYFHFAVTSLCNTSIKPLHLITIFGCVISFLSVLVALSSFVYKLFNWNINKISNITIILIALFFIFGVQLLCIGMLGEYIALVIRRTTRKPLVIEKEKINFTSNEKNNK